MAKISSSIDNVEATEGLFLLGNIGIKYISMNNKSHFTVTYTVAYNCHIKYKSFINN